MVIVAEQREEGDEDKACKVTNETGGAGTGAEVRAILQPTPAKPLSETLRLCLTANSLGTGSRGTGDAPFLSTAL